MKQKFIIFSPDGSMPKTTLGCVLTEPDENGKTIGQILCEGKNGDLLACFSSLVDCLINQCHIPISMVASAFSAGVLNGRKFMEVLNDDEND